MSFLMIGEEERKAIHTAIEAARESIIPWDAMKPVADITPDHHLHLNKERQKIADELYMKYPTQKLQLGTYRIAFSFEEQPAGLFRHMSVSTWQKRKLPHYEAVKALALEFGFSAFPPIRAFRIWNEEFERNLFAINVIEIEPS